MKEIVIFIIGKGYFSYRIILFLSQQVTYMDRKDLFFS